MLPELLAGPTPLQPWERRGDWRAAALLVAMVAVPDALQVVAAAAGPDRAPPRLPTAPVRTRRVGRRPGVRPPRSC